MSIKLTKHDDAVLKIFIFPTLRNNKFCKASRYGRSKNAHEIIKNAYKTIKKEHIPEYLRKKRDYFYLLKNFTMPFLGYTVLGGIASMIIGIPIGVCCSYEDGPGIIFSSGFLGCGASIACVNPGCFLGCFFFGPLLRFNSKQPTLEDNKFVHFWCKFVLAGTLTSGIATTIWLYNLYNKEKKEYKEHKNTLNIKIYTDKKTYGE